MDKGKGREGSSSNDRATEQFSSAQNDASQGQKESTKKGQRTGLLGSIAQSAQSLVTPEALSSVLASEGKGAAAGSSSQRLGGAASSQAVQDARAGASNVGAGQGLRPEASFRSNSAQPGQQASVPTVDYDGFAGAGTDDQRWSMAAPRQALQTVEDDIAPPLSPEVLGQLSIGPYSSTSQLDALLHSQVRESHRAVGLIGEQDANHFGIAWDEAQAATSPAAREMTDPGYHDAWAQQIPGPSFDRVLSNAESARGATFDALQQSVGDDEVRMQRPQYGDESAGFMTALEQEDEEQEAQSMAEPSGLSTHWRPPTPSLAGDMTIEQYNMHRALAEEQDHGKYAEEERIRPPDDDAVARTGVYAATPEEALQAIWSGQQEGERASALERDQTASHAQAQGGVVQRIRRLLQRGSYVDDVYGLPPALEATIQTASLPETSDNRAIRAKALARLEALYRHLDTTPAAAHGDEVKSFVRDW